MKVLGISAYYHDSAAALIIDGKIVAAAQEERFTRRKHDPQFPTQAINYCLTEGRIGGGELDYVSFYDKPFLKFERLLETYLACAPLGWGSFQKSLPAWVKDKLFMKAGLLRNLAEHVDASTDWKKKLLFSEHHLSHAASAFYPSPFEHAAILTIDGVGEWTTTSLARGNGSKLEILRELHFPHSIGLLYSAFTYYAGFKVNSGEYKVMGLAPYGRPRYVDTIKRELIDIKDDGSFRLNMKYFDYCTGSRMTNGRFDALFGGPARTPNQPLTQKVMDLAASIQTVIEEVVVKLADSAAHETGERNLCLAGGVALNCVANAKLSRERVFDQLWIQPAAGDAGGALGAALIGYYMYGEQTREADSFSDSMSGSYLGPQFAQDDVERRLTTVGARFRTLSEEETIERCAQALTEGKIVGWHQGRMEFGPRALGARSILADPRSETVQKSLNLKIKFRESFRPFAPSVLREHAPTWFDLVEDSPYMLLTANILQDHRTAMTSDQESLRGLDKLYLPRSSIPAVTHVDFSARVQTVHQHTNPRYHALISRFFELTGCPLIVNTSFNVRGEPVVCTPEDSFGCFMGTGLDFLAVENCFLEKDRQDMGLKRSYQGKFELD